MGGADVAQRDRGSDRAAARDGAPPRAPFDREGAVRRRSARRRDDRPRRYPGSRVRAVARAATDRKHANHRSLAARWGDRNEQRLTQQLGRFLGELGAELVGEQRKERRQIDRRDHAVGAHVEPARDPLPHCRDGEVERVAVPAMIDRSTSGNHRGELADSSLDSPPRFGEAEVVRHLDRDRIAHLANNCASSANALNSSALPLGSRKNIVACSPGWPTKRMCGAIPKTTPAALTRSASARQSAIVSTTPKCGTGTAWPSTAFSTATGFAAGSRCATI